MLNISKFSRKFGIFTRTSLSKVQYGHFSMATNVIESVSINLNFAKICLEYVENIFADFYVTVALTWIEKLNSGAHKI
jgi:hypothetical protein